MGASLGCYSCVDVAFVAFLGGSHLKKFAHTLPNLVNTVYTNCKHATACASVCNQVLTTQQSDYIRAGPIYSSSKGKANISYLLLCYVFQ